MKRYIIGLDLETDATKTEILKWYGKQLEQTFYFGDNLGILHRVTVMKMTKATK